ncbi:DUF4340 domain-containing protein [Alteromonas sp. CYL-A6]|uniref:DUF4340 domain-containing protein n=1 Tax=Alteromonas nitratireducens TaxID=3390813 RepID=UPI0034BE6FFE
MRVLVLAVIAACCIAGLVFIKSQDATTVFETGQLLAYDIEGALPSVNRVSVSDADGLRFEAVLNDDVWMASHLDSQVRFPVDKDKLSNLVTVIQQAKVLETKTADPRYYRQLGVEPVTEADATSVEVTLATANQTLMLLAGQRAQSGRGQFVRINNRAQTLLIDEALPVPGSPYAWLTRDVLPFETGDVRRIVVRHGDEQTMTFVRDEKNTWLWEDIPATGSLRYPEVTDATVEGMLSPSYEAVSVYLPRVWESLALAGDITFILESGYEVTAYVSEPDERGNQQVWFSLTGTHWISDWVLTLSAYQAGRLLPDADQLLTSDPDN